MSDTQTARQDDGPPYPTWAERRNESEYTPTFSDAYQRLIWPIKGEFPSAIAVMLEPQLNIGPLQPLYNAETGEWHEIASQSITYKKVSSLEASLENLDGWALAWDDYHVEHAEAGDGACEFVPYDDLDPAVRESLQEDDSWSMDDSPDGVLVRCCGEDRPVGKRGRRLEVRPSPGNDVVTIKDYVGAVHPWFMSMQDDIIGAVLTVYGAYPTSTEWRLSTHYGDGPVHVIEEPETWDFQNSAELAELRRR